MNSVARAHKKVAEAAAAYESRWTLRALLTHDRDLYERFRLQQNLWGEALIIGNDADIREQTAAMCRGWAAIALRMDEAEIPDDAYLIGSDDHSGVTVAISAQRQSLRRVQELYGDQVVWMTPTDVAALMGRSPEIRTLFGIFPGAELLQ
jgi:hypothetical protein